MTTKAEIRPMQTDRILKEREVLELISISRATLWNWMKEGSFPQRIKLSPGRIGWRSSEVQDWIANRPKGGCFTLHSSNESKSQ